MQHVRYQIGENRTHNALQAWDLAFSKGVSPILDLGVNFTNYDWTKEPEKSIQVLEDEYAIRLSQSDKPCRLFFSGGTDSYSVAHAFCRNKLPLRYTMVTYQNMRGLFLDALNWVTSKQQLLFDLHKEYGLPEPEIEVIEVDQKILTSYFSSEFFQDSSYYGCNRTFNTNQLHGMLAYSKWPGETTLNIFGIEKPRLYMDDQGKVFWQITDTMSMYAHSNRYDSTWFYMSDQALDLVAKQAWSVFNHVAKTYPNVSFVKAAHELQTERKHYLEWCLSVGRRTNAWWANMSKACKATGTSLHPEDDTRYNHIQQFTDLDNQAWRNYRKMYQVIEDLTHKSSKTSVLTSRFYMT